jgi:hypothetical protein
LVKPISPSEVAESFCFSAFNLGAHIQVQKRETGALVVIESVTLGDFTNLAFVQSKEIYMAACKFTSGLTIKQSVLPVTCKLQNPPASLTIALAQLFDANGTATTLIVSADGQSFVIPKTIATGSWTLEVRIQGGPNPIPAIQVVENCDASQLILTITDPVSKMARAAVGVQS